MSLPYRSPPVRDIQCQAGAFPLFFMWSLEERPSAYGRSRRGAGDLRQPCDVRCCAQNQISRGRKQLGILANVSFGRRPPVFGKARSPELASPRIRNSWIQERRHFSCYRFPGPRHRRPDTLDQGRSALHSFRRAFGLLARREAARNLAQSGRWP